MHFIYYYRLSSHFEYKYTPRWEFEIMEEPKETYHGGYCLYSQSIYSACTHCYMDIFVIGGHHLRTNSNLKLFCQELLAWFIKENEATFKYFAKFFQWNEIIFQRTLRISKLLCFWGMTCSSIRVCRSQYSFLCYDACDPKNLAAKNW